MATVNQRLWKVPGQRTKRKAWGFTAEVNGKRVKSYKTQWAKEDAEKALAAALLEIQAPVAVGSITLAQAAERYLAAKGRKRTLAEDKRQLEHLKSAFGADTLLSQITAAKVSAYKTQRLSTNSERTDRPLTAAAVNRPLALLRHLLRLAHEEWEILVAVPKIRLEKEPQGRIRWLEPDEESRLLAACGKSQNRSLLAMVTVALETGLRKGELLGLTWDRVDFSRGILRLEVTKNGKRREVPMRQAVYAALSSLPGLGEGPRVAGRHHPHRLRERHKGGKARWRVPLPRHQTPLRKLVCGARRGPPVLAADPRPRYTPDDHAIQSLESQAPARRDGED